jgi:hypothetical protein
VGDSSALGGAYTATDVANWNGPYLGASVLATALGGDPVITSGFGANLRNRLPIFDINLANGGDSIPTSAAATGEFVTVLITGLSGAAFNTVNEVIDGPAENTAILRRHQGRLRCPGTAAPTDADACAAAYFLASPIRQ